MVKNENQKTCFCWIISLKKVLFFRNLSTTCSPLSRSTLFPNSLFCFGFENKELRQVQKSDRINFDDKNSGNHPSPKKTPYKTVFHLI